MAACTGGVYLMAYCNMDFSFSLFVYTNPSCSGSGVYYSGDMSMCQYEGYPWPYSYRTVVCARIRLQKKRILRTTIIIEDLVKAGWPCTCSCCSG